MVTDRRAALVLGALLCAACTVGPDARRTDVDVPPTWTSAHDAGPATDLPSRIVIAGAEDPRWWRVFGDPILDSLVDTAMDQSLDVQQAGLRIAQARAQRDAAAGAYYPSVQASDTAARLRSGAAGIGQALSSGSASGGGAAPTGFSTNLFQVGFDATWEPDLFGRTRRNVEAAEADIRVAEDQRRDAMVSLAAEIARAYLGLRGAERERAITLADLDAQQRLQALIASRNRAGLAPSSDVVTQRAQVAAGQSRLPQIEQRLATDRNRLALLLAMQPGALDARLGEGRLPALPPEVPVGLPGDLLRRRPDIRRREAEVDAATARIGVATAALFPRVRFGAVGSLSSNRTSELFDWDSRFGLIGAQLSIPIFQGGQLRSQVRVADLRAQEAILGYRQVVLNAFHEVDNAMTTYAQDQRRAVALDRQVADSRKGRDLAHDRYANGLGAYVEVLDAEHRTRQAELDLAESNVTASTDLVALFKALGGGWQDVDRDGR